MPAAATPSRGPDRGLPQCRKGVVVHRERCKNLADMREKSERLVALRWDELVEGEYSVELRIEVENRRGMIAVIATRINSMGVNIEKISTDDKDYQFTYVDLEMLVHNRVHLAHIMKRLRAIGSVRKVTRTKIDRPLVSTICRRTTVSNRAVISTPDAPAAIGPYSQAIKVGNTVWLSGQIRWFPAPWSW